MENKQQQQQTQLTIQGSTGKVIFSEYGSGTITGTAAYNLSVDTSGNIIETANGGDITGSGTLNKVPRWTATGSDLGDGPITFSNASATATSTFGGDIYSDEHAEADYFVATGANTTNSADKIVMELFQSSQGGHSVYDLTTSNLAQYLIKLKSSDASLSSNALLLTGTLAQFGTGRITIGNQLDNQRLISMGWQQQWEFYQNSQTNFQFRKGTATTVPIYEVSTGGDFILNQYGSGTKTGTPTYNLSVDSAGKIIETASPSTSLLKTVTNSFTAAQILTGGSLTFTMPTVPVGKQLLIQNILFYMAVRPQAGGPVYFNAPTGYSIQLKFDDGFSVNTLPLSNAQAFLNQGSNGQILMSNSVSASDYPFVLGDIVSTGGGTMNLVFPPTAASPSQGNGELYISIEYKEIEAGLAFTL